MQRPLEARCLTTHAFFKRTPGRLTIHYASVSSLLSGYSNWTWVNLKRRNTNQLEPALPNLIKTECSHRGFEFGGPNPGMPHRHLTRNTSAVLFGLGFTTLYVKQEFETFAQKTHCLCSRIAAMQQPGLLMNENTTQARTQSSVTYLMNSRNLRVNHI